MDRPQTPVAFIDANVIIRQLTAPVTPEDREMAAIARDLLLDAARHRITIWLSDAVVAEALYILTSPRHYAVSRERAVTGMMDILHLSGCALDDKDACIAAVEMWGMHPKLSFVDCLVAARTISRGGLAATFDRRLQRVPGLAIWPPMRATGAS
ncbi:MAG: PIN domain-containing protein [Chloroflexota bacterium]